MAPKKDLQQTELIKKNVFGIGQKVLNGRYEIEDFIRDKDGTIQAYKARNTTLKSSFTLKFQQTKESNEDFNTIAEGLMHFKGDENVANTIAKWVHEDKDSKDKISFVVQEYLVGESFDDYFNGKDSIESKQIKLIEVGVALARLYDLMGRCDLLFKIDVSNILICDDRVKITNFKIADPEKNGAHYLLEVINGVIDSIYIRDSHQLLEAEKEIKDKIKKRKNEVLNYDEEQGFDDKELEDLCKSLQGLVDELNELRQKRGVGDFGVYITNIYETLNEHEIKDIKLNDFIEKSNAFKNKLSTPSRLRKEFVRIFEESISNLLQDDSLNNIWPLSEERNFYATLLLKSNITNSEGQEQFIRTYFGRYENFTMCSWSDWEKDRKFFGKSDNILIGKSCAGFPIVWYNKDDRSKIEKEHKIIVECFAETNRIKYVLTHDVMQAKQEEGLIRDRYQKGGWNLTTKEGKHEDLSAEVQVLITIPIYKPFSNVHGNKDAKSILGVAHFELIQSNLPLNNLKEIAEKISALVQSYRINANVLRQMTEEISQFTQHNAPPIVKNIMGDASVDLVTSAMDLLSYPTAS